MAKWIHTGGGCLLTGAGDFPCDDVYENEETTDIVVFETTQEAHLNMPSDVTDLELLKKMPGVKVVRDDA